MKQLGAKSFYKKGEADEATSLELVVEPWLEGLDKSLKKCIADIKKLDKITFEKLLA